jgi:hypothetical protein
MLKNYLSAGVNAVLASGSSRSRCAAARDSLFQRQMEACRVVRDDRSVQSVLLPLEEPLCAFFVHTHATSYGDNAKGLAKASRR